MGYCAKCGNEISKDDLFCRKCGNNVREDPKVLNELKKISRNQDRDFGAYGKCPRCGSTSLSFSGHTKGYSWGKALFASCLVGPFGPLFGIKGKRKSWVVCLNCGKRFKR